MGLPNANRGVIQSGEGLPAQAACLAIPSAGVRFETAIRLLLGLSAASCGLFLLLWRGYQGWPMGLLGGACFSGGIYALLRAAQCWRGKVRRQQALRVAAGSGLILGIASCCFLSHWVQEINEAQAWRRHQQAADTDAYERFWEYNRAVPEPFRRRQAEADYLLALVRSGRQHQHQLRWTLEDVQARFGDDPTFDLVRQAIRAALESPG